MRVRPPLGPLPSWVPRDISWIHSNIFYLGRLDEIKIQSLPLPQFVKDGGSRINTQVSSPRKEIFPKWSPSKYFVFMLITPDLPQLGGTELEFPNNLAFSFCCLRGLLSVSRRLQTGENIRVFLFVINCGHASSPPDYVHHPYPTSWPIKYKISRCSRLQAPFISVAPHWRYPIINPLHVIAPWELKVFDGSEKSN